MPSEKELEFYRVMADELKVVFDVGCKNDNTFHDLIPGVEVHQFDPKDYSATAKGKFNQVALSHRNGKAKFYPEYSSLRHRTELTGEKWKDLTHESRTVKTVTLDKYCADNGIEHIDLLKIDAEGFDYNVLKGAKKMLPNIKYIQFEDWIDDSTDKIKKLLGDAFTVHPLGGKPLNYIAIRK